MTELFLIVGTALTTISFVPYVRDIIRHGARPRLVSWVIWSVLLVLMTVVAVQEHQWGSAFVTGVSTIGTLTVVCLGWRYASRGVTRLELVTLLAAAAGVAAWFVLDNTLLVMAVVLAVDALAYVPTFIHGWQQPEEESTTAYAMGVVGQGIIIAACWLQGATLLGFAYPVYAALFGVVMLSCIGISRWWYGTDNGLATESY